jgi:hypothetical protein
VCNDAITDEQTRFCRRQLFGVRDGYIFGKDNSHQKQRRTMCCAFNERKNQPTSEQDRDLCMYAKEKYEDENKLMEELLILLSRASCQVHLNDFKRL